MSTPPAVGVDNVDKRIAGAETPDAEVVDTEVTQKRIADTEIVDTEMPDTETPDTDMPDTEMPVTEMPDTEVAHIEKPNAAVENEDELSLQPAPEGSFLLPPVGPEGSQSPLFLPSPVLEASAYRSKIIERDGIEVKVPPVKQRWEYRPYNALKYNVSNFHFLFQIPIIPHRLINYSSSHILVEQRHLAAPTL